MNNKVLVVVEVPLIEKKYEVYIPINKKIGFIKQSIVNSIKEKNDGSIDNNFFNLVDKETGLIFDNNKYVKDSNIRNGSVLFLI